MSLQSASQHIIKHNRIPLMKTTFIFDEDHISLRCFSCIQMRCDFAFKTSFVWWVRWHRHQYLHRSSLAYRQVICNSLKSLDITFNPGLFMMLNQSARPNTTPTVLSVYTNENNQSRIIIFYTLHSNLFRPATLHFTVIVLSLLC